MKRLLMLAPVAAVVLVTACGGSTSDGALAPVPAGTAQAGAAQPGVVRLLTHDSFAVSDSLKAAFEKSTGLTLEIVTAGDAGTMVAGAVLAAGSPTADVMFGTDNTLVSRATKAGVFWPYNSPDVAALIPSLT
ncbi:MAG: hypothetical protein ORN20_08660, partial [Candidatus Nanopelagicales bacterium]|nr:hypothetical protein [Candidatus Nanopelagicales bacterium]